MTKKILPKIVFFSFTGLEIIMDDESWFNSYCRYNSNNKSCYYKETKGIVPEANIRRPVRLDISSREDSSAFIYLSGN